MKASNPPDYTDDLTEERASILEYEAGLPRDVAQNKAAQMHGFKDWREYVEKIRAYN